MNIWGVGLRHQTENEFREIFDNEKQLPRFSNNDFNQYLADNNTWIDYPVDEDENGLYDRLEVNLGTAEQQSQDFYIYGILKNKSGSWLGYASSHHYSYSTADIILQFGGQAINASGLDGQYDLWITTFEYSSDYNFTYMYTTGNYNHNDFESSSAMFTGFSDYGSDTDGDSLFDEIVIDVSLQVSKSDSYTVGVVLVSDDIFSPEAQSLLGYWNGHLDPGNRNVEISISTNNLFSKELNGPYPIGFAYIFSSEGFQHFLTNSGYTNAYNYTDFEPPAAYLTGQYWDKGEDTDGDGTFNQLVIDVGINVTEYGSYSLDLTLEPSNAIHLSISASSSSYYNWGVHNISVIFEDIRIFSQRLNTSYLISLVTLSDSYTTLDIEEDTYTTNVYSFNEFDPPIAFMTGRFWDKGIDTDDDGKFNQLIIDVEVNITQIGSYYLNAVSRANVTDDSYSGSNYGYWDIGVHNISLIFGITNYYSERVNTSYILEYARIRDYNCNTLDAIYPDYSTRVYNFSEFDPPEVYFTGNYVDKGLDTDGDGKYNHLTIDIEVNVTQTGEYYLDIQFTANISDDTYYNSTNSYWNVGIQNITIIIEVITYYSEHMNTSYNLEYARIRDNNYNILDTIYPDYSTRIYNFSEFDPPEVYFTGNYIDKGLDTDGDGKYNHLTIDIEVNVTQTGSYYLNLEVRDNVTGTSHYGSSDGVWNEGIQNISVRIGVSSYYSRRVNISYIIELVEILNGNYSIIERFYPYLPTRLYTYNEFDPPGIYLTGNYWEEGIDTDADNLFNEIKFEVEVNVTQIGEYNLDFSLRSGYSGSTYYSSAQGYWGVGLANVSISLDASRFYSTRVNQTFEIYRINLISSNNSLFRLIETVYNTYTTRIFNYTEFDLPRAYFTGIYYDEGLDTDGDGKFNQLIVNFEVNVTYSGNYYLEFRLRSSHSGSSYSGSTSGYLIVGLINVSVPIDASTFYYQRINTTYVVEYAYIHDFNYNTEDYQYPNFLTRIYNYTEFDFPESYFTGNYYDAGLDTNGDSKFDQLVFNIEVNTTQAGDYYLEIRLRSSYSGSSSYSSVNGYWNVGVSNVSVVFDTSSYFTQRVNTSYIIEYVYIRDSSYVTIDRLYPYFQTHIYDYTEFDPPGAYFTENYYDKGLDTDGDGKFNQLVIDIEVNVTQAGTYDLELRLASSITGENYYEVINGYWNIGIFNISISFDTVYFYTHRLTSTYVIEYIYLRDASYVTMDRLYP
ncbi:MAG: hypothetical protein ACW99A_17250, partial [Candidatus Kariarchaeaceae archaeon]